MVLQEPLDPRPTELVAETTFEYLNIHMVPVALQLQPASQLFKALGDETRLRIVALLSHGELCVCHIEAALKLSQPTVSRHLGVLKNAGVVNTRRDGNWIHYRLAQQADTHRERQLRALVRGFADKKDLARDVERLLMSRGPTSCQ